MPANEQTWRDTKLLHVVFGVSALVMLITTVWMMADDHNRPWKDYQRTFRNLEVQTANWRADEQKSTDYAKQTRDYERALTNAQESFTTADRDYVVALYKKFKEGEEHYIKLAKEYNRDANSLYDRDAETNAVKKAKALADEKNPEAVRQGRTELLKQLSALVDPLKSKIYFRENNLNGDLKDARAYFSQAQSQYAQAVERGASDAQLHDLQAKADDAKKQVDIATALVQAATAERKELEATLKHITAEEDKAKKTLDDHKAMVEQYEKAARERAATVGRDVLEMPVLDAFNSPLKIENRWLPQLPWYNNFKDVARFDRCETCHQGVERTLPGSPTSAAYPSISHTTMELATPATPPIVGAYGITLGKAGPAGVAVEKVAPKSLAADAGLKANDQIKSINDVKMDSPAAVDGYLFDSANSSKPFKLVVTRGKADLPVEMPAASLQSLYGIQLASAGVFKASDVTLAAVYPRTPAAVAGLMGGDVIETIDGARMSSPNQVVDWLMAKEHWGKTLKLLVRRGVPEPFTTHPRLELFVGSLSPHPVAKFGCTICHQGQGSATAFKWASHTPNDLMQNDAWTREHEWFDNENWTYPMFPKRFEESTCLKCHHEVVELERSREFPDPPAPKVVAGYEIIRRYGCFGCHEINGFDGKKRIGPDMRLEPNYAAAAEELLNDPALPKLDKQAVKWATELEFHPENETARHGLLELISAESDRAKSAADGKGEKPVLDADSLRMEGVLKDVENPGTERKVGPSLRHVASKLDFTFMTSWIDNPQNFRPNTRMPRFFGQWDHLDGRGLEESKRFEPVEVRGIVSYLLNASQPFEYAKPSSKAVEEALAGGQQDKADHEAAIARGKKTFQLRGCLACHQHADFKKETASQWNDLLAKVPAELRGDDFPELKATQGPDLSRMGAKLEGKKGRQWLYSWVRNPSNYHPRTFMPVLFLDPEKDANGKESVDPAADVTEFLMNSQQGWTPSNALPEKMSDKEESALADLVAAHLTDKISAERAKDYAANGIPVSQAEVMQGDESLLVNPDRPTGAPRESTESGGKAKETEKQKSDRLNRMLIYVGRRSIGKYGCYACHDVPGFEDAKPIGTSLADWGRKLPSRLAFEQIAEYLTRNPHGRATVGIADKKSDEHSTAAHSAAPESKPTDAETSEAENEHEFEMGDVKDADLAYFLEKLLHEEREGFIWQKLRAPRSYDFKKTENKKYSERLRMPKFTFAESPPQNQQKIEQVMTFVLGLVSEPPPPQFIYHPTGAKDAIVSGRKVLEKFNCAGCHILEMERWDLEFKPGELGKKPTADDFPFVLPHFTAKEIDDSKTLDRRGLAKSTIFGMPKVTLKGAPAVEAIENEDDSSKPPTPTCTFMNFQPALIDGGARVVGKDLQIPLPTVARRYPALGGELARYALPYAVSMDAKTLTDYKEKPNEAWGWLPPPLVGEGKKVQTDWLHDFLLDPFVIRPAAVLRMPKFNMSSAEASRLATYFAAVDGAEYPYEFDARTRSDYLEQALESDPKHLDKALDIVVDNSFCVKCHKVGDFSPTGSVRAMAPQLENVHSRLRPEYVHRWIADPASIVPYTAMPQNFPPPPKPPVALNLFPVPESEKQEASQRQIDALVDLLMNFDRFTQGRFSIKSLVKPAAAAPAAAAGAPSEKSGAAGEEK